MERLNVFGQSRVARRKPARRKGPALPALRTSLVETLESRRLLTATLGTASLVEGPAAGSDSDLLVESVSTTSWTASTTTSWLHLAAGSVSGTGSATILFSYDQNSAAAPRTGSLTIDGQALSVTQGPTGGAAIAPVAIDAQGFSGAYSPVVDAAGDVFYLQSNTLQEWFQATGTTTTLISSGLSNPGGIALDSAGNVFIANTSLNEIEEWSRATQSVSFPVTTNLKNPGGVAVDAAGNVYIADSGDNAIKEWNENTNLLTTVVSSNLTSPHWVAVDATGNLYIPTTSNFNFFVDQWSPSTGLLTPILSSSSGDASGVVDGAGHLYVLDSATSTIKEWSAATGAVTTVVGTGFPTGMGIDANGNLIFATTGLFELAAGYLNALTQTAGPGAGSGTLGEFPLGDSLPPELIPSSGQPWLTIGSPASGQVSYQYSANPSIYGRNVQFSAFGQTFSIWQNGVNTVQLGASSLIESSSAGSDSDLLYEAPSTAAWNASTTTSWLHLAAGSTSGTGSSAIAFSFDANTSSTARTGTISIAGQTLSVVQAAAGTTPATATPLNTTGPAGLSDPQALAVDAAGNVYFANGGGLLEWSPTSGVLTRLTVTGVTVAIGVAFDPAGNLYILNNNESVIKYSPATQSAMTLFTGGPQFTDAIAVDSVGDVFVGGQLTVEEWSPTTGTFAKLNVPIDNEYTTLAVDKNDNLYYATSSSSAVYQWSPVTQAATMIVSFHSSTTPQYLAVDASGHLYIGDTSQDSISEWFPATGTLARLSTTSSQPGGVAVDPSGNLYFATLAGNLYESPAAYLAVQQPVVVDSTGGSVSLGTIPLGDAVPASLLPVSNQSWLTITSISGGALSVQLAPNSSLYSRSALVSAFGQQLAVMQSGAPGTQLGQASLLEGAAAGSDSDLLYVSPGTAAWNATSGTAWLHVAPGSVSGTGSADIQFSFDVNSSSSPRSGTLTIGGQTLTVTQAAVGSVATAVQPIVAVASPPVQAATSMTVDASGNVYFITEFGIERWSPVTGAITQVLNPVSNVFALDAAGDVYWIGSIGTQIEELPASTVTPAVVLSGLSFPTALAADPAGNLDIADRQGIQQWNESTGRLTTLTSLGGSNAKQMTVDGNGDVFFISNIGQVQEYSPATAAITNLTPAGLASPRDLAVDGAGHLFIANSPGSPLLEYNIATGATTSFAMAIAPLGVAVDPSGAVYTVSGGYVDSSGTSQPSGLTLSALAVGYLNPQPYLDSSAGSAVVGIFPLGDNLPAALTPTSNAAWISAALLSSGQLTVQYTANSNIYSRSAQISAFGTKITVAQSGPPGSLLGTTSLVEGAAAGSDSDVLYESPITGNWTASSTTPWLHVAAGSASGTGSATVLFSFDANAAATPRTGTINIAGQVLTVSQAPTTFVSVAPALSGAIAAFNPVSMAVDSGGNAYIGEVFGQIAEYSPATGITTTISLSFGLNPAGLVTDNSGNLDIAISNNGTVLSWSPITQQMTTLISGLNGPSALAVDRADDVFVLGSSGTVQEWSPATNSLTTLFSSNLGFVTPQALAVDVAGNVYVADPAGNEIEKWSRATGAISSITSPLWIEPVSVAVDGSGNLFVIDATRTAFQWSPVSGSATQLSTPSFNSVSVAATDASGNAYLLGTANRSGATAVEGLPRAYVGPQATALGAGAGSGTAGFLPADSALATQFPPTSTQPWLTITGVAGGQIDYSYTANTSTANRTAQISLLGQEISFTQSGLPAASLAATSLVEGPSAGSDSVTLVESPATATWTATSNASWLHVATGSTSGTGSATVAFTYDAAAGGASRTGTITIAGVSLTVTQAPVNYLTAGLATLIPIGLGSPRGIAVDSSGNLYVTNAASNRIEKWSPLTGRLTTLLSTGLNSPEGLALDAAGNIYIADTGDNAIKELSPAGVLTTLVSTGLSSPEDVAVDSSGNVAIADTGNSAIKQYSPANQTVTTLISSGLASPQGIAVDGAGNLYIANSSDNAIDKWSSTSKTTTALVSSGLEIPDDVAVDAAGNVYIADTFDNAIKQWSATTQTVSTLVSAGLSLPNGLAVDASGNIDITAGYAIQQWSRVSPSLTTLASAAIQTPRGSVADASGNVYIADNSADAILEWSPATGTLSTLANVSFPQALAIDAAGNLYFSTNDEIDEWSAASHSVTRLVTLPFQPGGGLAVDAAGNIYIDGFTDNDIHQWSPAKGVVSTLVSTGLNAPNGLAIDEAGNLYIADQWDNAIKEWSPTTNTLATVISTGLNSPGALSIDGSGNLYISDGDSLEFWSSATNTLTNLGSASSGVVAVDPADNLYLAGANGTLSEVPRAYFGPATINLPVTAGTGVVGIVPANASLAGPLAPTSDQPWLTVGSVGGPAGFSYTANTTGAPRTAHISLLGQSLTLTQLLTVAPTITTTSSTDNYLPNAVAMVVDSGLTLTDTNASPSLSATVSITGGFQTGDTLNFATQNGISGTYTPATGVLNLTGGGTGASAVANYQAALQSITFSSTSTTTGTRTVSFTVTDGTLPSAAAAKSISVVPYQVSSFNPNSTGFAIQLDAAPNLSVLNLYSGFAGALGTPDMTVLDGSTPVAGSLVWDPSTLTATFVQTRGVLAPGTYNVTLVSGSSAWVDTNGNPLDGGSNYTSSFTVGAPTAPVLTLPDFARGPGQSVNVSDASISFGTALTSSLPVALSDTTGVTSVSFELDYNSSYLTVSGVQLAAGISGTLSVTNTTPGVLLVSITGFSSTASAGAIGGTDIVDISASVPAAAISSYGASSLLKIVNPMINGSSIPTSEALEKVVYLGDANADGKLSAADATLVARNRVHLDSGFNAYALTDPRVVGNVTGAGTLASADASLIAQAGVHLAVAKIPTVPSHGTITLAGADPTVSIPTGISATASQTVNVPLSILDNAAGVASADFAIHYDPAVLSLASSGITLSGTLAGLGWTISKNVDSADGVAYVSISATVGLPAGTPQFVNLAFSVASTAATGTTAVTIDPDSSDLSDANGNALPLSVHSGSVAIAGLQAAPIVSTQEAKPAGPVEPLPTAVPSVDGRLAMSVSLSSAPRSALSASSAPTNLSTAGSQVGAAVTATTASGLDQAAVDLLPALDRRRQPDPAARSSAVDAILSDPQLEW